MNPDKQSKANHRITSHIAQNAIVDQGDGIVLFQGGLTLSDTSTQKNGTKYDINSMDISRYSGKVFADHDYSATSVIGKAFGVAKQGERLVAEGIRFAIKESGLARLVHDLVVGGYADEVSIGTLGDLDDDGVYRNARLLEFSVVGIGNNDNAHVGNSVAKNAIEKAKANGFDLSKYDVDLNGLEEGSNEEDPNKNAEDPAGDKGEETPPEAPESTEDEDKTEDESHDNSNKDPKEDSQMEDQATQNAAILEAITKTNSSLEAFDGRLKAIEENGLAGDVNVPGFKKNNGEAETGDVKDQLEKMSWTERTALQIQSAWKAQRNGDKDALAQLFEINKLHVNQLKEKGIYQNAAGDNNVTTITDFGNFVTAPEMLSEIEGTRTNYDQLLSVFKFSETRSLQTQWLVREGDINMRSVAICSPEGEDAKTYRKPSSKYKASAKVLNLEELAAVTPICQGAQIFLAADVLGDVAEGYRTDYKRKQAQAVIAALELAVEARVAAGDTGASVDYAGATNDTDRLKTISAAVGAIVSQAMGSVLVMNYATAEAIRFLMIGSSNGNMVQLYSDRQLPLVLGHETAIVPNDLLPTLGTTQTVVIEANGQDVTVNHAIFAADPSTFIGRVSGGLKYDLSTDASYTLEVETATPGQFESVLVSAYERNEIVARGSMYRGAAVKNIGKVAGVQAS